MRRAIAAFQGIEHRIEPVREIGGVQFSTTPSPPRPSATLAALRAFREPIVLLGGRTRQAPAAGRVRADWCARSACIPDPVWRGGGPAATRRCDATARHRRRSCAACQPGGGGAAGAPRGAAGRRGAALARLHQPTISSATSRSAAASSSAWCASLPAHAGGGAPWRLGRCARGRQRHGRHRPAAAGVVLALLVVGIDMVYSASFVLAHNSPVYSSDTYFPGAPDDLGGALAACDVLVARADYHFWQRFSVPLLGLRCCCWSSVLVPGIGHSEYGAQRWLKLGPLPPVQPERAGEAGGGRLLRRLAFA